jgi:conjugative transposon TraM protein
MHLNFKQPRYILPLILLPFLCLFFYVWHNGKPKQRASAKDDKGIQNNVGEVSAGVKKKSLTDKLDAFRNTYKESDGYSAVTAITDEQAGGNKLSGGYSSKEKEQLDSIDKAMKARFQAVQEPPKTRSVSPQDKQVAAALNALAQRRGQPPVRQQAAASTDKDPMAVFKQQMAYVDSIQKANDPQAKAEAQQRKVQAKLLASQPPALAVRKAPASDADFNTISSEKTDALIAAMIDEDVTAYAGSRIRLRLLEDIWAGKNLIRKGSYLYAIVSGFTQQRVSLTVTSVLSSGQILPVKLSVYDQDGLQGLFVPASAFRDFTKDLTGNTMQGVSIESGSAGSQLLMSSADKIFQSTSSAISNAIRKNKAKIKYSTYVYLIDPQTLQNTH